MKRKACLGLLIGALVFPLLAVSDPPTGKEKAEGRIANFTLKDAAGQFVGLDSFKDKRAIVVVFIGTECPINNYHMRTLKRLHEEFSDQGVQLLAINSNSQDSVERIAQHAKDFQIPFPVLRDADHLAADIFQAAKTPEVFVLDGQREICYRGRIDDQYGIGYQRPKPTREDLKEALKDVLAGKPVSVPKTEVAGCFIGRRKTGAPVSLKPEAKEGGGITYTKRVARIIQDRCQECHRPGQIGPFSLMTYEKAVAWSDTIKDVVSDGRMPPWHADPRYGKFSNDRRLSPEDKATLLAWIDQGCPKGDEKDMPPPKQFMSADGWAIGKPDLVFSMEKEVDVPAAAPTKDGVPYKYFRIPTNLKEDVWIQAAEARPGNRAVVHHILVYVKTPEFKQTGWGDDMLAQDPLLGSFLIGTAPGDMPAIYRPGLAKKLPKGSTIIMQVHYTPNGVATKDRSSVGFILSKEPPKHVERTRTIINTDFIFGKIRIPAGDANFKLVSKEGEKFRKDAVLIGFMPHMHLRGKDFEYRLIYPDGKSEVLLSVPRFDFNWQSAYRYETPKRIPAGSRIVCTAHFDNSDQNPNNPDPKKDIRWGEQTWDEMMIGWLDYYYVDDKVE